ncbi:cell division protein FtsQ/DivIB [Aeromicrobium terrae]|uniref:FtsQ-type POTRA domain-containing protein n=1 Tax=Aeromicrobium terrae TaxID=2498846 RepID=A0A5C8NPS1_9ACTN|nr:FtsQ-type POTRA domain-containing protein [Aeromicrobium terrae]TXL62841.1 FtsQ-type POTRA domain-containing protein [Aeromicrobium terrae]
MSEERFAEKVRDDKRRRLRRTGLVVLSIVVAATLVWVVWFSQVLAVQTVKVEGVTTLKAAQVRSQAAVRLGEPLVRVDTAQIESRVAGIPRVQKAVVSRKWPHTLVIRVQERKAVAWVRDGLQVRLIDKYGIDFRTLDKQPKSLMEIDVTAFEARERQQSLEAAATVIELIRTSDPALYKQVQAVSADTKDSVELNLTKGRTVVWGSAAKGEQKIRVLRPLLKIKARGYDVSAPEQPTTKP